MQFYNKSIGLPLITTAILTLSLQGCNGSDKDDDGASPAKVTASLATPAISNLAYEGSLGSTGKTDNTGEYSCISDEIVTFKLGAVVLGAVTCSEATQTTLMQLSGSELTVETALDEMQKAGGTREVTAYDKWNNRLTLLAYLDVNADLSDGVQLPDGTDNIEFLESGKVNFDLDESLFSSGLTRVSEQIARAGLLERYVFPEIHSAFINELEKEAGDEILFPGYMVKDSRQFRSDDLSSTDQTVTYDEDKGLITEIVTVESELVSVISGSSVTSQVLKHNAEGRVVEKVTDYADGGNRTDTLEWDEQGKIIKNTAQLYDADGVKTTEAELQYSYNTDGSLDRLSQVIFNNNAQSQVTILKEYTYENGLLSQVVTDRSTALNGEVVDSASIRTVEDTLYSDDMNTYAVTTAVTDSDDNIVRTTTNILTRDDLGRVVSREYAETSDSNTFSNITEQEFNDDGYPVFLSRTYYQNGEEIGRYEDTYLYTGTPLGRMSGKIRKIYNPEYKNGEEVVRVFGLSYTYNDNGFHTSVTERTTNYQDGKGNELESPVVTDNKQVWTYDENNNPTSIEIDENGDGIPDTTESLSWVHLPRLGGLDEVLAKESVFPQYEENFNVYSFSDDAADSTGLLMPAELFAKRASGGGSNQIDDILPATPTLFDKSKLGF